MNKSISQSKILQELKRLEKSKKYYEKKYKMGAISNDEYLEKITPKNIRFQLLMQKHKVISIIESAKVARNEIEILLKSESTSDQIINTINKLPADFPIDSQTFSDIVGGELSTNSIKRNIKLIKWCARNFYSPDWVDDYFNGHL